MVGSFYISAHKSSLCARFQLIAFATFIGAAILYLLGAGLNFYFFFDRDTISHPKFLPNQIKREIKLSLLSLPWTGVVTVPWFFFELKGYSQLYDTLHSTTPQGQAIEIASSILFFLAFTDCFVYWIHRGFHHPWMYGWLHKPHHTWKVVTPFAALAFHWLVRLLYAVEDYEI